jgi:hypothetical protein
MSRTNTDIRWFAQPRSFRNHLLPPHQPSSPSAATAISLSARYWVIFHHELPNQERELGLSDLGEWGKNCIRSAQHIS